MHRFRDEVKLYKVIESCRMEQHFDATFHYIRAYETYYGELMIEARRTFKTRKELVCNYALHAARERCGLLPLVGPTIIGEEDEY